MFFRVEKQAEYDLDSPIAFPLLLYPGQERDKPRVLSQVVQVRVLCK